MVSVTAEQLEKDFALSEESLAALNGKDLRRGQTISTPNGPVNVKPEGRPSSFEVWAWDGTPSRIPIAYDAGGSNPRIDRYLRKRRCNSCGFGGFITDRCPKPQCGSTDTIRFFYIRKTDVPFPRNFTGHIPCLCSQDGPMGGGCPRRGENGFLDQTQMMMHAVSKHAREYNIWRDIQREQSTATGSTNADIAYLVKRIQDLEAMVSGTNAPVTPTVEKQAEPVTEADVPLADEPTLSMTPSAIKTRKYRAAKKKGTRRV